MVSFFKKNKSIDFLKNVFLSVLAMAVLLGLLGFLTFTNVKIKERREKLNNRLEDLQKELQDLQKKNEELNAGISEAGSKEYLEKIARERFNLKAPGEEVVVVAKDKKEGSKEETPLPTPEPPKVIKWWQWVKNKF